MFFFHQTFSSIEVFSHSSPVGNRAIILAGSQINWGQNLLQFLVRATLLYRLFCPLLPVSVLPEKSAHRDNHFLQAGPSIQLV